MTIFETEEVRFPCTIGHPRVLGIFERTMRLEPVIEQGIFYTIWGYSMMRVVNRAGWTYKYRIIGGVLNLGYVENVETLFGSHDRDGIRVLWEKFISEKRGVSDG